MTNLPIPLPESKNLYIIPADIPTLEAALKGDDHLQKYLNIKVPKNWSAFGPGALKHSLDKLKENASESGWWSYLPVHKNDNTLIGLCGFKGSPNQDGMVEIGYEISEAYRLQGYATELAEALISHAFSYPQINKVQAHTLGSENASSKVLSKCGFKKMEEILDKDHGVIWRWEISKAIKVPD